MSKLDQKWLIDYSLDTLRDVDFLGSLPKRNAVLRYDDISDKWSPDKLNVDFFSVERNPRKMIFVEATDFLIMKDPDIGSYEMVIEGDVDII